MIPTKENFSSLARTLRERPFSFIDATGRPRKANMGALAALCEKLALGEAVQAIDAFPVEK